MRSLIYTDASVADIICHSGKFHADDVFSTVFLLRLKKMDLKIARVDSIDERCNNEAIIFDIGMGEFDHHQFGGNGVRENGVPYASFGLLWKKFGREYLSALTSEIDYCFEEIEKFVELIDGYDNGMFHDRKTSVFSISNCISMFNPLWNEKDSDVENTAFIGAVCFADQIFEKVINQVLSKLEARRLLLELVENCNERYLILDEYLPISSCPEIRGKIDFIVYPSKRTGFNIQILNYNYAFPKCLAGASSNNLRQMTTNKSIVFVHNSCKLGGAQSLEDTIKMMELIESQ